MGKFITGLLDNWRVYQVANGYRVSAVEPTPGRANYTFGVVNGHIDKHANKDAPKIKADRPELYAAIEAFFGGTTAAAAAGPDNGDPYGDYALTQHNPRTPEQSWRRSLLNMRVTEALYIAQKRTEPRDWEPGVRGFYSGIFGRPIDAQTLRDALEYIRCKGDVDLGALLEAKRAYYANQTANRSEVLESQLDLLSEGDDPEDDGESYAIFE